MASTAVRSEKEQLEYDPIIAEVIQNRLRNISLEMATTLIRTSGSPILSEAKDFCCAIFDRKVEHIGFSGYVIAHMGSSLEGVRAVGGDDRLAGGVGRGRHLLDERGIGERARVTCEQRFEPRIEARRQLETHLANIV